ncbi:MAG: MFS transporter, partial [Candidatus Sulfotelmatobacter sp.]
MEGISWRQLTIAERAVQSAGMEIGPIRLIREATRDQRRTLLAAALGWALDAFDAMLYALVLALLIRDFGMSKTTAGFLGTLTLLASGLGGVMFGFLADRMGRKRALMASILTYSVCSFASGLATSIAMLATARFLLGLGMGGEWNTGAALVAETWPTELRAKAIAIVQSSWAIGFAVAALVAGPVARYFGWRAVFFVGILPAVLTLWMRRGVPESKIWEERKILRSETQSANGPQTADIKRDGLSDSRVSALTVITERKDSTSFWMIFRSPYLKSTVALLLFNLFCMFAWWGLFTWIPPYLSLPVSQGGRGFGAMGTTTLLVVLNLFGMFPGYASFGWAADQLGRKRAFIFYSLMAAVVIPLYAIARSPVLIMILGTVVAFFGTGLFSGSGIIGSEIFPTSLRARGLGFTYNGARTLSSVSPLIIGRVGQARGLG